jgi:hypothetical protein
VLTTLALWGFRARSVGSRYRFTATKSARARHSSNVTLARIGAPFPPRRRYGPHANVRTAGAPSRATRAGCASGRVPADFQRALAAVLAGACRAALLGRLACAGLAAWRVHATSVVPFQKRVAAVRMQGEAPPLRAPHAAPTYMFAQPITSRARPAPCSR